MPLFTPSSSPVPRKYLFCFHTEQITIKLSKCHEGCKKTHLQASHLIASSEKTDFSCFNLDLHYLYSRDNITCLLDIYRLEIEILLKKMRQSLGFRPISIKLNCCWRIHEGVCRAGSIAPPILNVCYWDPFSKRLGRHHSQSGRVEQRQKLLSLRGIEPSFLSLTDRNLTIVLSICIYVCTYFM